MFVPDHLQECVTPETMRTIATIGSPEEVTAELLLMKDAGVDQVMARSAFTEKLGEILVSPG